FTPQRFGQIDAVAPIAWIGAGHDVRCAVRADGALWCAGRASRGALGPTLLGWTPAPVGLACR
ncbi:MAG: hypothetical protein KBI14_24295, partial [Kofleriaceae bacterium]|nr:hypothetical protein [Kofleriaceae bacterium]